MSTSSPYDANNPFFQFSNPSTDFGQSAFSFQYNPSIISAYSANPNASIAGGISPTSNQLPSLQQQNTQTNQQSSPTSLTAPQLINYADWAKQQQQSPSASGPSQSNPSLNSNALNLVSTAAQHSGVGSNLLSGVTNSINQFGGSLGFGVPGGATETISPALAAADPSLISSGAGTAMGSLSGTLGAAGLGFIGGGILAHAIGGNETGGSIGGALGAAAGYAFGGMGAAALGLELGSFAGPIGAIVGGIGGALFGSVFGNHSTPTNADNWGATLTATGGITNGSGGSKNPGQYTGFGQSGVNALSSQLQAASSQLGIQFDPKTVIDVGISTQHGGAFVSVNDQRFSFTPGDNNSQQQAFNQAISLAASNSGYTNQEALKGFLDSVSVGGTGNANVGKAPPSIPNNPTSSQPNDFQTFMNNYKAQQNANAAPTPTS